MATAVAGCDGVGTCTGIDGAGIPYPNALTITFTSVTVCALDDGAVGRAGYLAYGPALPSSFTVALVDCGYDAILERGSATYSFSDTNWQVLLHFADIACNSTCKISLCVRTDNTGSAYERVFTTQGEVTFPVTLHWPTATWSPSMTVPNIQVVAKCGSFSSDPPECYADPYDTNAHNIEGGAYYGGSAIFEIC